MTTKKTTLKSVFATGLLVLVPLAITLWVIGLVIGTIGLLAIKPGRDSAPYPRTGMDVSFLVLLLLTSMTGFLVLFFRATAAMGILLLVHLGVVMGLFLTLPYGKFIHGVFRYAALARYAIERSKKPAAAPPDA